MRDIYSRLTPLRFVFVCQICQFQKLSFAGFKLTCSTQFFNVYSLIYRHNLYTACMPKKNPQVSYISTEFVYKHYFQFLLHSQTQHHQDIPILLCCGGLFIYLFVVVVGLFYIWHSSQEHTYAECAFQWQRLLPWASNMKEIWKPEINGVTIQKYFV